MWLRVSHEGAVKLLATAVLSEDLTEAEGSTFKMAIQVLVGGILSLFPYELLYRAA